MKLFAGLLLLCLGAFIIYVISRSGLSGEEGAETALLSGEKQYEDGVKKLMANDLDGAKGDLATSYDLGYHKASAPLGSCYLKRNDLQNAEKYLMSALDSADTYNEQNQRILYNDLGILNHSLGKKDDAIKYWTKAEALGSADAADNLKKLK